MRNIFIALTAATAMAAAMPGYAAMTKESYKSTTKQILKIKLLGERLTASQTAGIAIILVGLATLIVGVVPLQIVDVVLVMVKVGFGLTITLTG